MDWITDREPEEDGTYLVAAGYSMPQTDKMNYTVDGGWNTRKTDLGTLTTNNRGEGIFWGGYVKAWMPMPKWEEEK